MDYHEGVYTSCELYRFDQKTYRIKKLNSFKIHKISNFMFYKNGLMFSGGIYSDRAAVEEQYDYTINKDGTNFTTVGSKVVLEDGYKEVIPSDNVKDGNLKKMNYTVTKKYIKHNNKIIATGKEITIFSIEKYIDNYYDNRNKKAWNINLYYLDYDGWYNYLYKIDSKTDKRILLYRCREKISFGVAITENYIMFNTNAPSTYIINTVNNSVKFIPNSNIRPIYQGDVSQKGDYLVMLDDRRGIYTLNIKTMGASKIF